MRRAYSFGWILVLFLTVALTLGLAGCNNDDDNGFNGQTFNVTMTSLDSFDPVNITVPAGSRIIWTNEDTDPHTATADLENPVPGGPNSAFEFPAGLPQGETFTFNVPSNTPAGTVWFYHCCNHGAAGDGTSLGAGMSGSITVTPPI